ncbi:Maf family nucleotide pyrophosphatase [Nitrosomonas sp. Is37]|uniref:Maf family nucleotide pyrophosphatase n=1 Tax=Nitrosomonas sp. Is37 TaxID=3080535 RepID=UPI00294B1F17|nr:Maf family nucleotide pyrophosphatase [Nitrosomonas sp. Is37]MDV6343543.1 Maf family nucleotide pyrophosphatase [Nitrosomonas sp. Is37]
MKTQYVHPRIILGSSSLYRRELLQRLKLPFETANPAIDETPLQDETPEATALRLAENKAHAIAAIYNDALIIAADQVAVLEGIQLSKPLNYANAVKQLRLMRGKEIAFYTALCLLNSHTNRLQTCVVPYFVKFRELSDQQIECYLSKEQPYHCAGSAKSEGLGIALIERMKGDDPNALIGLPLIALVNMLLAEGVEVI